MSLLIETNVYLLEFLPWDYLSKLSCLDSLSNSDYSLERSITPTLLGIVGAFGIVLRASNISPNSP
jgi:hypothetical protein